MLKKSFIKVNQGDVDIYYVSIKLKDINESILEKRVDDYEGMANEKIVGVPIQKDFAITRPLIINSLLEDAIKIEGDIIIINTEFESAFELIYGYDEMYSLLRPRHYGYSEKDISCKYSLYEEEVLVAFTRNLDFQKKKELFENANLDSKLTVPSYLINKRKRNLNLMSKEEIKIFKLLERLNEEDESPLNSRISLYEKVVKGIDPSSLIDGIKTSNVLNYSDKEYIDYIVLKTLFKTFVDTHISNEIGKIRFYTKTANAVYVLNLLPYIWDVCMINKVLFTSNNIQDMLRQLNNCKGFNMDIIKNIKNESMAKSLAKKHGEEVKNKLTYYDVTVGI